MARLLSGSTIRRGGSGEFLDLAGAQPQLPPTPTTSTGFTLVTDEFLRTSYRSSLGNLEFNSGTIYSNLADGIIRLFGTGTGYVHVTSSTQTTSTTSGALVVNGGIGVGDRLWVEKDIIVNGLTIGQGFKGTNNIVIQGSAVDNVNEFNEGRASVAIGFDALTGLSTSLKSIAIGRYALSSGTNVSNSIAIGDSALKNLGIVDRVTIGGITSATLTSPIEITVVDHNITTGTQVFIQGVVGMTELNDQSFWVNWINSSTLALYTNNILTTPTTGVNPYISSGTVYKILERNNNIAIGSNAGSKLMDGVRNFFFGDAVAPNFTTGSNNFFIGHEVAANMITGNNNIAIGGDNLVNGQDDQVNIGSVFYYDGAGYTQLNSDIGLGLGSESTSTTTGALTVLGGVGLTGNLTVGKTVRIQSTLSSTSTTTGSLVVNGGIGVGENINAGGDIVLVSTNGDKKFAITAGGYQNAISITHNISDAYLDFGGPNGFGNLYIRYSGSSTGFVKFTSTLSSNSTDSGSVQVVGGVGIGENLTIGGLVRATNTQESTTITNGSLVVSGGVGIQGNLNVGRELNVVGEYTATISPAGVGDIILQTRGSGDVQISPNGGGNVYMSPVAGDVRMEPILGGTVHINPSIPGEINNMIIGNLPGGPESAIFTTVRVSSTLTSTSTTTGALLVEGGVGILGDVYSNTGNPDENYMLYTPKVYVTAGIPPALPRIGDFWIDSTIPAYLQYIRDGTDTFWIQVGAV